jgi:hypothetical protein
MAVFVDTGTGSPTPHPYRAAVLVPYAPRTGLMPDAPDAADAARAAADFANLDGRYKAASVTDWELVRSSPAPA